MYLFENERIFNSNYSFLDRHVPGLHIDWKVAKRKGARFIFAVQAERIGAV